MSNVKDMMIRKPSLKYHDVREYEGKLYDWDAGEHLLKKGMVVDDIFHPLEHDIRFVKDLEVTLRDGVKMYICLPTPTSRCPPSSHGAPTASNRAMPFATRLCLVCSDWTRNA